MLVALAGCLPLRWAPQAVVGQAGLLLHRRPLAAAAADKTLPLATRDLLQLVPRVKAWGARRGLKPTDNYAHYVQLDGPAVAWVVSAAPALSLQGTTWRFPVVGDVPYVGWFSDEDARHHAAMLALEGLDVSVRPVEAYSTLGWLPDPVLSSMVTPGPLARAALVNTVLHESVHATLFFKDAGAFNETLASVVADVLTPAFLLEHAPAEALAWEEAGRRWDARKERLVRAHDELEKLYASALDNRAKHRRKHAILWALQRDVPARGRWNNASLSQFRTYDTGSDAFRGALRACGDDVAAFLRALRARGSPPPMAPPQALRESLQATTDSHCNAAGKALSPAPGGSP